MKQSTRRIHCVPILIIESSFSADKYQLMGGLDGRFAWRRDWVYIWAADQRVLAVPGTWATPKSANVDRSHWICSFWVSGQLMRIALRINEWFFASPTTIIIIISDHPILLLPHSTPLIENYAWPLHTRENPAYYIFSAEGHENPKVPKFGRGPMATSCAFWNDFLPRVRAWSGECLYEDGEDE